MTEVARTASTLEGGARGGAMDDFARVLRSQGLRVERNGTELSLTPVTPFVDTMTAEERDPDNWLLQIPDSEHVQYTVTLANTNTGETCVQRAACVAKRDTHRTGHLLFFDVYTQQDKLCKVSFQDCMSLDVTACWKNKSGDERTQTVVRGTFVANDGDTAVGSPGWAIYVNERVFVHVGAMKVVGANNETHMFVSNVSVSAPLLESPYHAA